MSPDKHAPTPLLERILARTPAAIDQLATVLARMEVSPAIPSRSERHPVPRRRDGLDDFHPETRRVVLFIPAEPARLKTPSDARLDAQWKAAQRKLAGDLSLLASLASHLPGSAGPELQRLHRELLPWVGPARDTPTRASAETNAAALGRLGDHLRRLLKSCLADARPGRIVRLIDTSALLECPAPRCYGEGTFDFIIPHTVLSELDRLKHHDQEQKRRRARRALTRIRGWWERRGDPIRGLTEDKTITIRFLPEDADMAEAPAAFSRQEGDDRILWTARQETLANPASSVVLVSGDSNLRIRAYLEQVESEPAPSCSHVDALD